MKYTISLFLFLGLTTAAPLLCDPVPVGLGNSTNCTNCRTFVQFLANETKIANATLYGLVHLVEGICDAIDTPPAHECSFITHQIENVLNYIRTGLSPDNICRMLDYCQNISKVY